MGIMAHYITDADLNLIKVAGNFGKQSYSTTEKFTGMYWTNGKPIYRRVYSTTMDFRQAGQQKISAGVTVSNLVRLDYVLNNNGDLQTHNSAITAIGYVNGYITAYCNLNWQQIPITFIMEYTK
jgi:hypothetical protein